MPLEENSPSRLADLNDDSEVGIGQPRLSLSDQIGRAIAANLRTFEERTSAAERPVSLKADASPPEGLAI